MIYWIFLGLAIIAEIIGTLSMKYASVSGEMTGHIVMYFMITGSYVMLSLAVKKVALGVAYALWEGIGILIITYFQCDVVWRDVIATENSRFSDTDWWDPLGEIGYAETKTTELPSR